MNFVWLKVWPKRQVKDLPYCRIAGLVVLFFCGHVASAQSIASLAGERGVPPLLYDALAKLAQNFDHWAYTETLRVTDEHGVPQPETVVRFDPSQPYAEQYVPLKIDGKLPTAKQRKTYRHQGEKRAERFARQETAGKTPGGELPRFAFNGGTASLDLAHATIAGETAEAVTFVLPLRNDGRATIPVEKFELTARVNRQAHTFENVALRVRGAFRVRLVVKVKTGAASLDFAAVDAAHPPVLTHASGDATATVLFLKFGGTFDLRRSDFKRVKPYSERFGVKIGPLKALDF